MRTKVLHEFETVVCLMSKLTESRINVDLTIFGPVLVLQQNIYRI